MFKFNVSYESEVPDEEALLQDVTTETKITETKVLNFSSAEVTLTKITETKMKKMKRSRFNLREILKNIGLWFMIINLLLTAIIIWYKYHTVMTFFKV